MKIYHRLILAIFVSIVTSQNSPYTIQSLPAYSLQRACVQDCVLGSYYGVAYAIGCPYPPLNPCACRTDLQSSASTFLTSCVNNGCNTNPPDLSSAISLYDSYCSMNGFPIVGMAVTITAATSSVTSLATVITVPSATVTVTPMATSTLTSLTTTISSIESLLQSSGTSTSSTILIPTTNQTPAHSNNAGAIAGGVVGGLAAIAIIAAIVFLFIHGRRNQQRPGPILEEPVYEQQQATGSLGSPAPEYFQNASPYPDVKTGPQIYEAAGSGPISLAERTYGASRENWKA